MSDNDTPTPLTDELNRFIERNREAPHGYIRVQESLLRLFVREYVERQLAEARKACAFYRSVILAGERWSQTCEQQYKLAMKEGAQ